MKKSVEQAFEHLNDELLLAMGSDYTSLADSILYGNLATDIQDVKYKYGHLIGRVGKEKSAPSATNTESGKMKGNTIQPNCSTPFPNLQVTVITPDDLNEAVRDAISKATRRNPFGGGSIC